MTTATVVLRIVSGWSMIPSQMSALLTIPCRPRMTIQAYVLIKKAVNRGIRTMAETTENILGPTFVI